MPAQVPLPGEGTCLRESDRLRPMIGAGTGILMGAGIAIGSGIFRSAGIVAEHAPSPLYTLGAWLLGGVFAATAGLLIAELSTRYPLVGGDYVYLKVAYGRFVAFFFGWGYTIFVGGCGIATMAAAFGDFGAQLLGRTDAPWLARGLSVGAIVVVTLINLAGLRAGAWTQNVLTLAKLAILGAIVVGAAVWGRSPQWTATASTAGAAASGFAGLMRGLGAFSGAMMAVVWCFAGTTDTDKLAQEFHDPRRSMPLVMFGTAATVTGVYLLLNWAFLRVLTPAEMAAAPVVPADVFLRWFGPAGGRLALLLALCVVFGALCSTILPVVRVPFALAQDGLIFRFMGTLSPGQAPTGALIATGLCAAVFAISGAFEDVLAVYTIATGVLFGLVNLSLFVIRRQEARGLDRGRDYFRCPWGSAISLGLAAFQFLVAVGIAWTDLSEGSGKLALSTLGLFAGISLLYLFWPKPAA